MKKIYIDTENLSDYKCLDGIGITNKDEILLFLTQNSKPLKPHNLHLLFSYQAKITTHIFEVSRHDELDTYINCHLSEKISNRHDYYIVSNDRGFESIANYQKITKGLNVILIRENNDNSINSVIKSEKHEQVLKIMHSSKDKNIFHNKLNQKFGKEGRNIYLSYRDSFDKLKKGLL